MRKAEVFFRASELAAVAASLALCVTGCSSGENANSPDVTAIHTGKRAQKPVSKPGEQSLADMVAAVSSTKSGAPVEVRFELAAHPEVGQVTDIEVAVIPHAPLPDSVSVSFQVVDGLEVVEGSQLERVDKLVDGTPIRHVVKIRPKRDGIFTLTAAVSYAQANQDGVRTFSIPVIAGEGLPEQVAKGP